VRGDAVEPSTEPVEEAVPALDPDLSLAEQLIEDDDLSGAYWLARALATAGRPLPYPEHVLAAAQGARWLASSDEPLVDGLAEIARLYPVAESEDAATQLLTLSAALRPSLLAPMSGMVGWLESVHAPASELHSLIQRVVDFASTGIALRPEYVPGAAGAAALEAAIRAVSAEARVWQNDAPARRMHMHRAARIWRHWVDAGGPVSELLAAVAADDRAIRPEWLSSLRQWEQQEYVVQQIAEADAQTAIRTVDIVGAARDHLLRGVRQATDLARRWYSLVHQQRVVAQSGNWVLDHVASLRADMESLLPSARNAIDALIQDDDGLHPAAVCLQRSLNQVAADLRLPSGDPLPTADVWSRLALGNDGLDAALRCRLLALYELPLTSDGTPGDETYVQLPAVLAASRRERRDVSRAIAGWLEKQDYRFIPQLLRLLDDAGDRESLRVQYEESLAGSRAALAEEIGRVSTSIEQAVLDGLISESEGRADETANLEQIDPRHAEDFSAARVALAEISERLQQPRDRRAQDQVERWRLAKQRLELSSYSAAEQEQAVAMIESAIQRRDVRVTQEYLDTLERTLDQGGELLGPSKPREDVLKQFVDLQAPIAAWLEETHGKIWRDIAQRQTVAGLRFGSVLREMQQSLAEM